MRDSLKTVVIAAVLAVPLGGCSLLNGGHLFARHSAREAQPVALAAQPPRDDAMTRAAREDLAADRPGAAVEKFQKALADGEPVAPALNGMAVAYARTGRLDLAERFFREAISVDPADQRYQTNLATLMESPAFTTRREAEMLASFVPPSAPAVAETPRSGQLQRVSRHEVRIVSAPAYPAPTTRLAKAEPEAKAASPASATRAQPQSRQTRTE